MSKIEIIPAILVRTMKNFKKTLEKVSSFSNWVQIDVVDGKFILNRSVKLEAILESVEKDKLFLPKSEIHLMVKKPEDYLIAAERLKTERVIVHLESQKTEKNVEELLKKMDVFSFEKGLAINPKTPVEKVAPFLDKVDSVLILSVKPGFQGGEFIPGILEKVKAVRSLRPDILLGIDGGIKLDYIKAVAASGVNYAVVGSGILKAKDAEKRYNEFVEAVG